MSNLELVRMEKALGAALDAFRERRAADAGRRGRAGEIRLLLARLGMTVGDLHAAGPAGGAGGLPEALRSEIEDRLQRERRRLVRLGRAGSARYDLDRHIAVRAALRWLLAD